MIQTIRESYDDAKENLMNRFGLSDVQAQAILDMQLKRLQGLEKEKLQNEYKELERASPTSMSCSPVRRRSAACSRTSSPPSGTGTATTG